MDAKRSEPSLETLLNAIEARELDLQPDFQRGEVWDGKRRQRLVDTVLRDWYVPAIHIVVDERGEKEAVLDGQQRLAALRDFVIDKFPIDGTIEPEDQDVRAMHGLHFSELSKARQRKFLTFAVPVVRLHKFNPQEPNELFFRLNQAYNLTPPEKRNALHGEARDQVRHLVDDLVENGLLEKERVGFDNKRLAYDDIVARVCVAVEMDTLRRHINNDTVEGYYRQEIFSAETLSGIRHSSLILGQQIDAAGGRSKFNKGTLQTWLIYCYWAPPVTGPLPTELLGSFEELRLSSRRGQVDLFDEPSERVTEIVKLYDDRASYRVTDVTSVLIRDAAIHLYSMSRFGTPSVRRSQDFLSKLKTHREVAPQLLLDEFLAASQWGEPLLLNGRQ